MNREISEDDMIGKESLVATVLKGGGFLSRTEMETRYDSKS
jgi:hypothetical protein